MKCYSMVSVEYDMATGKWAHANRLVSQFGDTAVVIRDGHTFIDRVVHALANLYGVDYCTLVADRVSYFSVGKDRGLNCMFHKEMSYAWQNEFRILFSRACPFEGGAYWKIVKENQPVALEIGDITDIAYEIPVGYLIHGKWWSGQDFRFAMGPYGEKTKFEGLVNTSRELIGDYDPMIELPKLVGLSSM